MLQIIGKLKHKLRAYGLPLPKLTPGNKAIDMEMLMKEIRKT